ncbi:MAG: twitch domain-containing radical SAM protein [Bacteroidales bacterium]|nr:twitch domain-containing radical SAM protein [Bacteroidales bacterium]
MNTQNPYCLMPWVHFHVGNEGYVKACCVANITYGNINTQSLDEVWNGEAVQGLREKFLKGEIDKRCAVCYKLEEAGGRSIRQETFEKFEHLDTPKQIINERLPIYFDIRFSNKCNFRCRTCWHGASSGWYKEAKELGNAVAKQAVIQNIKDFDSFIEKMGEAILQAEEIYFAGGEPLVMNEHYLLLDYLIKNNATKVRLRYNTNFSILSYQNYDILKYWKQFESVEILASIDAMGDLGEYIRKGMKWEVFLKNRELIRELPQVKFKIAPTVSVFNIRHLSELYKFCVENNSIGPDDLYINMLERPYHFNVKILPKAYKEKVEEEYSMFYEWLNQNKIDISTKLKFKECIDYMMAEDLNKYLGKFISETDKLDKSRVENRSQVIIFE